MHTLSLAHVNKYFYFIQKKVLDIRVSLTPSLLHVQLYPDGLLLESQNLHFGRCPATNRSVFGWDAYHMFNVWPPLHENHATQQLKLRKRYTRSRLYFQRDILEEYLRCQKIFQVWLCKNASTSVIVIKK